MKHSFKKSFMLVLTLLALTFSALGITPVLAAIDVTSFAAKVDFNTGFGPFTVAIGDLDGDGKPDLVVTNYLDDNLSVFLNTSTSGTIDTSSFAAGENFSTGERPTVVAIGDLDGDLKPDLAVANRSSDTVSVFLNTSTSGNISFATKVDFNTGDDPYSVAIGDMDGDGKPDLAVTNYSNNTVSVFLNTSTSGNISFATKVDFSTGEFPYSVAIGDLDGDSKPDLAVTNLGSDTVSVFLNTSTSGNISFATKVDFNTGDTPLGVAIGDLDGDSKPDLALANSGSDTISTLRNTSTSGNISFATKVDFSTGDDPYSVAIGDLDGDSKPDLAVTNYSPPSPDPDTDTISLFLNTSTSGMIDVSSFATKVDFSVGNNPTSVAIGDLDGDSKPDLAVTNFYDSPSHTVSVLRNTGLADVNVSIAGTPVGNYSVPFRGSLRQSYVGVNDGPVQVFSTNGLPVVASERVIYKVNGINTSFSEMMGLPVSELTDTYYFPWYNNVDLDTQLRFGNVGSISTDVTITVGTTDYGPYTLAAGASTRVSLPGVNDGPVQVHSTGEPIIAAERVIYKVNGINTSFSEMMGLPDLQLTDTFQFPWYNNVDLDTQLRFGNVGSASTDVTITVGSTDYGPYTLAAGASTRISLLGVSDGLVTVHSTGEPIIAAERVIYKVNGTNTSFSEMMGLPNSLLDTEYLFPWYNNVDLDTQLRFGAP